MLLISKQTSIRRAIAFGVILACATPAMATLGQTPGKAPVSSPSVAKLKSITTRATSGLYTLHETQLANETLVSEYADLGGRVFAISWRGPVLPDLNALLGDYFSTFKTETTRIRLTGQRGAPVHIEREDVVIRSQGRMGHFLGHAYAPDLIPAGVNVTDVLP